MSSVHDLFGKQKSPSSRPTGRWPWDYPTTGRNLGALVLALSLLLVAAGCAARDDSSGERRPGGFYVGGSGGVTRP